MKLFATRFSLIRAASSASASASLAASGRSSGRSSRIDFGTAWEISVSSDGRPSAESMAFASLLRGPTWRAAQGVAAAGIVYLLADRFLVGRFVQQRVELACVGQLHLPEPTLSRRSGVDEGGIGRK